MFLGDERMKLIEREFYLNKLIQLSRTLAIMFPKFNLGTEFAEIKSTEP